MQPCIILRIFIVVKMKKIQMKKDQVLAQYIDCGYSLEPKSSFRAKVRKMHSPVNSSFTI